MTKTASATGIRTIGYIIVFVRDMARAVRFYRDTLGIPVKFDSEHWTEFDLEGATLALHWAEHMPAAPAPVADPGAKTGVAQEIVFQVEDPIGAREALRHRGVNVAQPKMVHEAGDMVGVSSVFEDPDGNVLSVYGLVSKARWGQI